MGYQKNFFFPLLTFACFILISCKKSSNTQVTPEKTIQILATYDNSSGSPSLVIDASTLPPIVQGNLNPTTSSTCQIGRVCLNLTNVRFKENDNAYSLVTEKSKTYELIGSDYRLDVENTLITDQTRSLDFILVLDISSSLGTDEVKVKEYAKNFIDQIAAKTPNSRVGIVVFSGNVETLPLTNDFNLAKNYFENKTGIDQTKLYEAIDNGYDLLQNSTADGKAIITFTDGLNNAWSDPIKYQTISYILNKLNQPINGGIVSSFTIGLRGTTPTGVDANSLSQLAMNGGISQIADNSTVLETIFSKFANSVSAVYTLTYNRNASLLAFPIQLKFELTLKKLE